MGVKQSERIGWSRELNYWTVWVYNIQGSIEKKQKQKSSSSLVILCMLHDHGNMLSSNHWSVIVGKCAHLWNSLYMYIYVCVKTPQNSWKTVPLLTYLAFVKSEFVETFIISTMARKCFFTTYTNHSCWHWDICIRAWGNHSSLGNPPVWDFMTISNGYGVYQTLVIAVRGKHVLTESVPESHLLKLYIFTLI